MPYYAPRQLLQLAMLGLIVISTSEETGCSTSEATAGYASIAQFSSCSGLSSDDIAAMVELIEGDGDQDSSLKGTAEACSTFSTSAEKQLCLAAFMNTLAADGMFTSEESENNDDGSSKDIVTTCGCFTTAIESLPDCGVFSAFLELKDLLPIEQGVCGDLADVCSSVSLLATTCLSTNGAYVYDTASCEAVLDAAAECGTYEQLFWAAEVEGTEYCGLEQWKIKRLEDFYDSCPHALSSTDANGDDNDASGSWNLNPVSSGERIVRLIVAVIIFAGLSHTCYMYARYRRTGGLLQSEYSPLGHEEDDSSAEAAKEGFLFLDDVEPL